MEAAKNVGSIFCWNFCVELRSSRFPFGHEWICFICNSSGDNVHPIFFLFWIISYGTSVKWVHSLILGPNTSWPLHNSVLWCTVRFVEKINKPNNIHFTSGKWTFFDTILRRKEIITFFVCVPFIEVNNKCLSLVQSTLQMRVQTVNKQVFFYQFEATTKTKTPTSATLWHVLEK